MNPLLQAIPLPNSSFFLTLTHTHTHTRVCTYTDTHTDPHAHVHTDTYRRTHYLFVGFLAMTSQERGGVVVIGVKGVSPALISLALWLSQSLRAFPIASPQPEHTPFTQNASDSAFPWRLALFFLT